MKILAIETSCDETALALLEAERDSLGLSIKILGESLYSQTATHAPLGGVVPNLAKREHARNLPPLLEEVLKSANSYSLIRANGGIEESIKEKVREILIREDDLAENLLAILPVRPEGLDLIAVTEGPGLEPALWVGINFAKALSLIWKVPVVPINHMEGHIVSSILKEHSSEFRLDNPEFPLLALLISGGHTELVLARGWGDYEIVGETRDDAVGEAFDKVARMLELPYPGGPEISKLAERAREENLEKTALKLPRPMLHSGDCDFSFAGLKTAVLYHLRDFPELDEQNKKLLAREFEDAVGDVLLSKTNQALKKTEARTLILGGGVSANAHIRRVFLEKIPKDFPNIKLLIPDGKLTTDNAVMIGAAAAISPKIASKKELTARGHWRLGSA